MNIILENKKRDIYLTDEVNAYFIPKEWIEHFTSNEDGLHHVDELTELPSPEVYCYAPQQIIKDSFYETLYVPLSMLKTCREITEDEAKIINPKLFDLLQYDELDEYEDPNIIQKFLEF